MILEYQNKYFMRSIQTDIKNISDTDKFNLLNYLIYRSLLPFYNLLYFKSFLGIIVKHLAVHSLSIKRNGVEAISAVLTNIKSDDSSHLIDLISNYNLDKLYFESFILQFLKLTKDYENDYLKGKEIDCKQFDDVNPSILITVIKEVRYFYNAYLTFKSLIVLSYAKSAYGSAIRYSQNYPNSISVDCLYDNYISAVERAIEKYSPSKGTLAPYIKLWYKSILVSPLYPFEDRVPFYVAHNKMLPSKDDKDDNEREDSESLNNDEDDVVVNADIKTESQVIHASISSNSEIEDSEIKEDITLSALDKKGEHIKVDGSKVKKVATKKADTSGNKWFPKIDTIKIETSSEEFEAIESKGESLLKELDFSEANIDLINFINSVENEDLYLARLILDIPRISKRRAI